jgi:hypothetical protein
MAALLFLEDLEAALGAEELEAAIEFLIADDDTAMVDAGIGAALKNVWEAVQPALDALKAIQSAWDAAQAAASAANEENWAKMTAAAMKLARLATNLATLIGMIDSIWRAGMNQVLTFQPKQPGEPSMEELMGTLNTASQAAENVLKTWATWIQNNFDQRNSFGMSTVDGLQIETFLLFHAECSTVTLDMHDAVSEPIKTLWDARHSLATTDVLKLYPVMLGVCQEMLAVCTDVDTNFNTLVAGGLTSGTADIQQAIKILSSPAAPQIKLQSRGTAGSFADLCAQLHRPQAVPGLQTVMASIDTLVELNHQTDPDDKTDWSKKLQAVRETFDWGTGMYSYMADWLDKNVDSAEKWGHVKPGLSTYEFVHSWVDTSIDQFSNEVVAFKDGFQTTQSQDDISTAMAGLAAVVLKRRNEVPGKMSMPELQQICADGLCPSLELNPLGFNKPLGFMLIWIDSYAAQGGWGPPPQPIISAAVESGRRRAVKLKFGSGNQR